MACVVLSLFSVGSRPAVAEQDRVALLLALSESDVPVIRPEDLLEMTSEAIAAGDRLSNPQRAWAHFLRGECRKSMGSFERAIEDIDEAVRLDPSNTRYRVHANSARTHLPEGPNPVVRRRSMVADLENVVSADTNCGAAWAFLAQEQMLLNEPIRARQSIEAALAAEPDSPFVQFTACSMFQMFRDSDRVLSHAESTTRLDPAFFADPRANEYILRSLVLIEKKRYADALSYAELISWTAPDDDSSLGLVMLACHDLGYTVSAKLAQNELDIRSSPLALSNPRPRPKPTDELLFDGLLKQVRNERSRAVAHVADLPFIVPLSLLEDLPSAIEQVERVPTALRGKFMAHAGALRARLLMRLRDFDAAIGELRPIVENEPSNREFRLLFARALWLGGRTADSRREIETLLAANRSDPAVHTERAELALAERNPTKAHVWIANALELDPSNARGYYVRGLAHAALGRFPDAAADLDRAIWVDPTISTPQVERAHLQLARILNSLGKTKPAVQRLLLARRLGPGDIDVEHALWQVYHDAGRADMALYLGERLEDQFRYEPRAAEAARISRESVAGVVR